MVERSLKANEEPPNSGAVKGTRIAPAGPQRTQPCPCGNSRRGLTLTMTSAATEMGQVQGETRQWAEPAQAHARSVDIDGSTTAPP